MKASSRSHHKHQTKISDVNATDDKLTARGGLTFFVHYLNNCNILRAIETLFGKRRRSRKGQPVGEVFKQILCFFMDGTSRHISHFDRLKNNSGYAGTIETQESQMQSSESIKRFLRGFSFGWHWVFRQLLGQMFLWRLKLKQPDLMTLGIDTMVMDNDESEKREGVAPTYKRKKGFQPLQMTWGRYMIDAIFRSGDKHSNYSDHVEKMIYRIVHMIRENYRADVPIVICLDSGFFDQKIFDACEALGVGYICGGKLYGDIKEKVSLIPEHHWDRLDNGHQVWSYTDFIDRRESWDKPRRAVFCHPIYDDNQQTLAFVRPDTILYTNIGQDETIDIQLVAANHEELFDAGAIMATYHARGADELVHRVLKDFGHETLPFKRFHQNAAWYYMMLIAFFLFETFKEDVSDSIVAVKSYATTFRRQFIDIAAKIVSHAGKKILLFARDTFNRLNIHALWERCNHPPIFSM